MGTKTPYGLTVTGQRSTSYSPGMLSGLTNRYNSIGDAGGIMADSSPSVDTWDGIGRDPSLKTPAELAAEASARAKAAGGDDFNSNIPTLDDIYGSISETFGGMDTASQAVSQAQASDYLMGMTQSQDAATSPFDIINGNTTGSSTATLAQIAARNNTAGALPTSLSPLEQLEIELASDEAERNALYGTLDNNFQGTLNNRTFTPSAGSVIAAQNADAAINAAGIAALTPAQIAAIEEANELLAEKAAAQATIDAAAAVQQQDDDFQTKVNAIGGMNKGTIGDVIDAAQEIFGGNTSRAIVTVIAEALKSGVTIDDLAAETGMTQAAILAAAKDAGQDQDAKLSTQEMIEGGLNTAYDVVNSAVELVEKGFEITGVEKVINAAGNLVAKIGGLDSAEANKVLVVNANGGITIEASQDDGTGNQGGLPNILPTAGYVPIGSTTGGTTYGVDTGLEIVNTVLQKIITNGGLTAEDTESLLSSVLTDVTGIDLNAANNVIDGAQTIVDTVKKVITDATETTETTTATLADVTLDGGTSTITQSPLPACPEGQTQINTPGDCYVAPKTLADVTLDGDTTTMGPLPACPEGQTQINTPGDCYVVPTVITENKCPPGTDKAGTVIPSGQTAATFCSNVTDNKCPVGTDKAGTVIPSGQTVASFCSNTVITSDVCPADAVKNAGVAIPAGETAATFCNKECPGGVYNPVTDTCNYTEVTCSTIGWILDPITNLCKEPPSPEEEDDRTVVPPTTLGLPPRFVGESDVLVENPGAFQTPYSILPAPVTDPYLADRRSRDIRNVASSVGIQPGAAEQPQQAVDRFAQYANNFDVGIPELSSITGTPVSDFSSFEERYGISLPKIGTAPPVTPTSLDPVTGLPIRTPISGERYVPEPTALDPTSPPLEGALPIDQFMPGGFTTYIDPVTGLPTHTNPNPGMFADGGVVENGGGIESLLDRRQQAVNRMLTKRARGLM